MRRTPLFAVLLATIFVCGLAATFSNFHTALAKRDNSMPQPLTIIRLGNPQLSDIDAPGASVDNHPTGMAFYQRSWVGGELGNVEFSHGPHSFTVENVLSILGTADQDVPEGIFKWNVNFGVSPQQADTDEAARARVMSFLAMLRAAGWKRYIDVLDPRLLGRQAWTYGTDPDGLGLYSLDSSYTPTLDEWTAAARYGPRWKFQADGVYLEVVVSRSNMGGFVGKSTYLISVKAQSEFTNYGIGFFSGKREKIMHWKDLIAPELARYHKDRLATEAKLRATGYTIDTTYQDPPIKSLQSPASDTQRGS